MVQNTQLFSPPTEKLTGPEMGELRDIIVNDCFPNIGDFKEVLLIGLDIRYDNRARGGNPQEQVLNLIKDFLEPDDLILDLLEAMAEERPKKISLQEFQEKYLLKNFRCEDDLLPLWDSLKPIIRDIEFSILAKVCRNILPPYSSNTIKISNIISLMKIFCVDDISIDKTPRIIKFTQELWNNPNINISPPIRDKLGQWLQNLPAKFKDSVTPSPSPNQTQKDCFIYVLIRPELGDNFRVIVELMVSQGKTELSRKPINLDQQEQGSLCSFEDVPKKITRLMEKTNEFLPYPPFVVTVEFFLPVRYLGQSIEQWKISDDFEDLNPIFSIKNWRCVSRSYERTIKPNLQNSLVNKWNDFNSFKKFIAEDSDLNQQKLREYLETKLFEDKLNLVLPDSEEEFFKNVLKKGIPFLLWYRGQNLPTTDQEYDKVFNIDTIKNLNVLKELIYKKRMEVKYSIGLLLEDPDRWPNSQSRAITTGN